MLPEERKQWGTSAALLAISVSLGVLQVVFIPEQPPSRKGMQVTVAVGEVEPYQNTSLPASADGAYARLQGWAFVWCCLAVVSCSVIRGVCSLAARIAHRLRGPLASMLELVKSLFRKAPALEVIFDDNNTAREVLAKVFDPTRGVSRDGVRRPRLIMGEGKKKDILHSIVIRADGEARAAALIRDRGYDWYVIAVGVIPDVRMAPMKTLSVLLHALVDRFGEKAGHSRPFCAITQLRECPEMASYFQTMLPEHRKLDEGTILVQCAERDVRRALTLYRAGRTLRGEGSAGTPFEKAQARAKLAWEEIPLTVRGKLYAAYKQSTAGDAPDATPSDSSRVRRQMLAAWRALKGMSRETAQELYINLVGSYAPPPPRPEPLRVRAPGVILRFEAVAQGTGCQYTPEMEGMETRPPFTRAVWNAYRNIISFPEIDKDLDLGQYSADELPYVLCDVACLFDACQVTHDVPIHVD
eukprot:TRINITY_DN4696_c0_g1_i2.p1 TRINITY_DN4696_c0_g1~~TRINITY_DN4696_c0_g1_i2.p1  ORF type:complete len:470 (+),score=124.29 TRINITY_DN4696_c0_g1_i2:103-1512(+)